MVSIARKPTCGSARVSRSKRRHSKFLKTRSYSGERKLQNFQKIFYPGHSLFIQISRRPRVQVPATDISQSSNRMMGDSSTRSFWKMALLVPMEKVWIGHQAHLSEPSQNVFNAWSVRPKRGSWAFGIPKIANNLILCCPRAGSFLTPKSPAWSEVKKARS